MNVCSNLNKIKPKAFNGNFDQNGATINLYITDLFTTWMLITFLKQPIKSLQKMTNLKWSPKFYYVSQEKLKTGSLNNNLMECFFFTIITLNSSKCELDLHYSFTLSRELLIYIKKNQRHRNRSKEKLVNQSLIKQYFLL